MLYDNSARWKAIRVPFANMSAIRRGWPRTAYLLYSLKHAIENFAKLGYMKQIYGAGIEDLVI
jgi:hypothetical protein